jgi:hypothetical protein
MSDEDINFIVPELSNNHPDLRYNENYSNLVVTQYVTRSGELGTHEQVEIIYLKKVNENWKIDKIEINQ